MCNEHTILRIAEILRETHPDIVGIFTKGGCFEFFRICHSIYPEVECWGNDEHVYAKIGNTLIDINGPQEMPTDGSVYPLIIESRLMKNAPKWKDSFWEE